MGGFTLGVVWLFSLGFGAWTALAVAQAVAGRPFFRFLTGRVAWSAGEIKVSGWSWAMCGLAGAVFTLVGALTIANNRLPQHGIGSPLGLFANPWPFVFLLTSLFQVLIEQHHKRRWPYKTVNPRV